MEQSSICLEGRKTLPVFSQSESHCIFCHEGGKGQFARSTSCQTAACVEKAFLLAMTSWRQQTSNSLAAWNICGTPYRVCVCVCASACFLSSTLHSHLRWKMGRSINLRYYYYCYYYYQCVTRFYIKVLVLTNRQGHRQCIVTFKSIWGFGHFWFIWADETYSWCGRRWKENDPSWALYIHWNGSQTKRQTTVLAFNQQTFTQRNLTIYNTALGYNQSKELFKLKVKQCLYFIIHNTERYRGGGWGVGGGGRHSERKWVSEWERDTHTLTQRTVY